METPTPFQYTGLENPRSIRLCKVLPRPAGACEWDIYCTLCVQDLDSPQPIEYDALSYTWGDSTFELNQTQAQSQEVGSILPFIWCDGKSFTVGWNLFDALIYISNEQYFTYIWIDALCVNQSDAAERSSQVSFMGDIYATARSVFVWLGNGDNDSAIAVPLITKFHLGLTQHTEVLQRPLTKNTPFNDKDLLMSFDIEKPFTDEEWVSIGRFYSRPWFDRAWVSQEVGLAKMALVSCGNAETHWNAICDFGFVMVHFGWQHSVQGLADSLSKHILSDGFLTTYNMKTLGILAKSGLEHEYPSAIFEKVFDPQDSQERLCSLLIWLLYTFRSQQASDPRDKVYAPLAFASRFKTVDAWDWIEPDYRKSVEEVYLEASLFVVSNKLRTNLLSFVEDKSLRRIVGLPSWVPDFSVTMPSPPLMWLNKYNATKGWEIGPDPTVIRSDGTGLGCPTLGLSIRALKVDMVHETTAPLLEILKERAMLDLLSLVNRLTPPTHDTTKPPLKILTMTVTASKYDEKHDDASVEEIYKSGLRYMWHGFLLWAARRQGPPLRESDEQSKAWGAEFGTCFFPLINPSDVPYWQTELVSMSRSIQDSCDQSLPYANRKALADALDASEAAFLGALRDKMQSRCLITVKEHNTLGLAPQSTIAGDSVWLIHGSSTPFILRSRPEGGYELVGEAYVYGCMEGECIEKGLADHAEDIVLY